MAKTALVTGATDGVGRVVAKALGKDGWRVLVHGRDRERGEALVQEIEQAGGSATFLQADLASLAEVRRLADEVRKADRPAGPADQQCRHRHGRRDARPADRAPTATSCASR